MGLSASELIEKLEKARAAARANSAGEPRDHTLRLTASSYTYQEVASDHIDQILRMLKVARAALDVAKTCSPTARDALNKMDEICNGK